MSFLYPIALETLHAAPYSIEHAFFDPSVQQRVTSKIQPLSSILLTGLPTIATPTTSVPLDTATQNLAPAGTL